MKLAPVQSLAQLQSMAFRNEAYKRLALISAETLGGKPHGDSNRAMEWLNINADDADEQWVVKIINLCREMV